MAESSGDLRTQFQEALDEGLQRIAAANDIASLDEAQVRLFGRKSPLSRARSSLGGVSDEERPELGRIANETRTQLEAALEDRRRAFQGVELEHRWERERIDVTEPGDPFPVGSLHPLTRTIWEIVDIFIGMGFRLAEGPEVELSTYNFDALNTPVEHPSRSPIDTYYIEGTNLDVCLRAHTSTVQIRSMEAAKEPPVYVVAPGRAFRRDEVDPTHLNQFTQLEGLAVDEGITMGDLKGTMTAFARALFGRDLQTRFRPSFFPFTEPSAEMDVQCFVCRTGKPGCRVCKGEGWVELGGAGMVDPTVLDWVGFDSERYTGFAFGCGIERMAMLAHGVPDLRYFYENDLRFLGYFRGVL
jgi:phenylalanyl-tRNA synthetase alpha chain